ncbi:MAG: hypothetical protein IJ958_10210 [Agathobacter sp.]|nr:hypothetical protein [Agathobacter sp.]
MARKSVVGQLNMFDLYATPLGDVEMVSLMPSLEESEQMEEAEVDEAPKVDEASKVVEAPNVDEEPEETEVVEETPVVSRRLGDDGSVVMSRSYEKAGEKIEIAYMNYNKVRIQKGEKEPEIKVFASSKEAVDFYVQEMQALEDDE